MLVMCMNEERQLRRSYLLGWRPSPGGLSILSVGEYDSQQYGTNVSQSSHSSKSGANDFILLGDCQSNVAKS
jgi:hypothetical protein